MLVGQTFVDPLWVLLLFLAGLALGLLCYDFLLIIIYDFPFMLNFRRQSVQRLFSSEL